MIEIVTDGRWYYVQNAWTGVLLPQPNPKRFLTQRGAFRWRNRFVKRFNRNMRRMSK